MLSVLIAVYNSEKWLPQCLDSLLNQAYRDIEVVAVDDCSTDSSLALLQSYACKDARVKVIHLKKNCGQTHARNIALTHATGEWTMMLDSDDWIGDFDEGLLAILDASNPSTDSNPSIDSIDSPSLPDCLLLQCDYEYPDGTTKRFPLSKDEWSPQEAASDSIGWNGIHGLYIIRTDIHKRHPYDESTPQNSDENTTCMHFLHSSRIVATDTVYHYRLHPESTTHRISERYFNIITAHTALQRTLEKDPLATPKILQKVQNLRWRELTDSWHYYVVNRDSLGDKEIIERKLRLLYDELISKRITDPLRHRFGYWQIRPYSLYTMHAKLYFCLRRLLGKE